jgi:hypothetical protein
MGGGRNCTLVPVDGEPISKWTCKCRRGYWDSGKQQEVLGGPIGRGEAATRTEYEAHKSGCATCRDQAKRDDWNSLRGGEQRPVEPVCTVDRRYTGRHARREGWEASLESQHYGDLSAEQPARRHVSRDRMSSPTHSQWSYSDSGSRGTDFSGRGEAPFYTLFPQEDTAQRTVTAPYPPSVERPQDVRVPPRRPDTLRRDSTDEQRRGSVTSGRRGSNTDSRDRAIIQDTSRHREPSIKSQTLPAQSPGLSKLARRFVDLGLGRYSEYANFISDNPEIVAQSEINALVAEALIAEKAGQSTMAQTCIHQAKFLRECENLGLREIYNFTRKLEARDGKARDTFVRDVKDSYISIREQAKQSLQQDRTVASEPYGRKGPIISQATDITKLQEPSRYSQSPPRTTQAQTQVARDREGGRVYIDDQGRALRPGTIRHDSAGRRSVINPGQTATQQYRGATEEPHGRNQPTISQTADRTAYMASTTSQEAQDFQRESRYPSEDVSGGMARLQINPDARSDDQDIRAKAKKEVLDRLRRSGQTAISKQELERLIDEQLKRFARQKQYTYAG